MEKAVIRATLDLLLTLHDSTTGFAVDERNVRFIKDGDAINAEARGEGYRQRTHLKEKLSSHLRAAFPDLKN